MKKGHASLLSILSDGEIHSGEKLALEQNISRAAVWKSIKQLQQFGVQIDAERGKGYRLISPLELLSVNKLSKLLPVDVKRICHELEVLFKTDSTNKTLLKRLDHKMIHGNVVFAEYQSQGRGRRGNEWLSPLGSGIMFSVGWHFDITPKTISLLSLFIGVAVARTLQSKNISNLGLKWPNDILLQNKKIGGILIDVRGEVGGPIDAIIGLGLNYQLTEEVQKKVSQPITDLKSNASGNISRNELAADLVKNIIKVLKKIETNESTDLLDEWRQLDCYVEKNATLILPNDEIHGVIKGIDDEGSLLMSVSGKIKRFNAGEISLRASS